MAIKIKKETNGLYSIRVWATKKDEFGKRKTKYKSNIKSFKEANELSLRYQEELDIFGQTDFKFNQLESLYMKSRINMAVTTKYTLSFIRPKILDYFKNVKAKDVNTRTVQQFVYELSKTNNPHNPKNKLKSETIKRYVRHINAVLNWAVGQDLLEYNRVKRIEYPEDEDIFEPTILQPNELGEILKYIKINYYNIYMPILLESCLGLRRGESLGLIWDNINFENNTIYIGTNLVQVKNNVQLNRKLKTKKSRRILAISSFLKSELLKHKEMTEILHSEFVCINIFTGEVPKPSYLTKTFHKIVKTQFNISMRLHDLRHCFNHYANENNTDFVTMMNMLGHTQEKTNLHYAGNSLIKIQKAVDSISNQIQEGFI